MSVSGQDALRDFGEWSGYPPCCWGVVRRPSQMSVSGREILTDVREWSGCPS